jgi:hypothetical protein
VIEHLEAVMLLVLDGAEAEVQLCQQFKVLDVAKLQNFLDSVKTEVQEAQLSNVLEPSQESNVVTREVQRA